MLNLNKEMILNIQSAASLLFDAVSAPIVDVERVDGLILVIRESLDNINL